MALHLQDGGVHSGRLARVGADWCALVGDAPGGAGNGAGAGAVVVPLWAVTDVPGPALAQRMGVGFVLRDLVRRRIPVALHLEGGRTLDGTIDRAGADHLDVALHEPGAPRRAENVTGYRIVPFAGVLAVRLASASDLA